MPGCFECVSGDRRDIRDSCPVFLQGMCAKNWWGEGRLKLRVPSVSLTGSGDNRIESEIHSSNGVSVIVPR